MDKRFVSVVDILTLFFHSTLASTNLGHQVKHAMAFVANHKPLLTLKGFEDQRHKTQLDFFAFEA
jgi:hypothetical protein